MRTPTRQSLSAAFAGVRRLPPASLRERIAASSFHAVEGGAVVYEPRSKRLFALNPSAAFVWLGLAEGADDMALVRDLMDVTGAGEHEAAAWVQQALDSFSDSFGQSVAEP